MLLKAYLPHGVVIRRRYCSWGHSCISSSKSKMFYVWIQWNAPHYVILEKWIPNFCNIPSILVTEISKCSNLATLQEDTLYLALTTLSSLYQAGNKWQRKMAYSWSSFFFFKILKICPSIFGNFIAWNVWRCHKWNGTSHQRNLKQVKKKGKKEWLDNTVMYNLIPAQIFRNERWIIRCS